MGAWWALNAAEAITFLQQHQPMPPDAELTADLIAAYDDARTALQVSPNQQGLELLLNSFGDGSGFGVYQLVDHTLRAHPREDVILALGAALRSPVPSVRSWCMELALDYPDPRLVSPAVENLLADDRDTRYFAASFLADSGLADQRARTDIAAAASRESDAEIRSILEDLLEADHTP